MDIPKRITPELAEETGLHIGDGSMGFYKNRNKLKGIYSLRGHRIDDRSHYEQRIKWLYEELYNFTPSLRDMPSSQVFGFQKWSSELVNFKHKRLGLPLGKKIELPIKEELRKTDELKVALVKGIFDTDGNIYLEHKNNKLYPKISIVTISSTLAYTLNKMLLQLGLSPTVYEEDRAHRGWSNIFIVNLRGDKNLHRFMDTIQPANPKHQQKYKRYLASQ
jgi:intein/homing endonuclease